MRAPFTEIEGGGLGTIKTFTLFYAISLEVQPSQPFVPGPFISRGVCDSKQVVIYSE